MANNVIAEKLYNLNGFQREFNKLLYFSVSDQFTDIIYEKEIETINIKYLLECASIFAQSTIGKYQDVAFRIAQYALQYTEYKNVAVIILDQMTNYSAIKLAEKKKLIKSCQNIDYPFWVGIDSIRRKMECSVWDEKKQTIQLFNRFQSEVYEAFYDNSVITISAPTSAGKSYVMLKLIKKYINEDNSKDIVYLVPTRALIQQVYYDINELIKNEKFEKISVSAVPVLEKDGNRHVYVFTQERMQWFMCQYSCKNIGFVLVDEAQKIGDDNRGILLQQVVEQLTESDVKVMFASPMTENPELLLDALGKEMKSGVVKSEQVTVNQNLIYVNCVEGNSKKWDIAMCYDEKMHLLGTIELEYRCTSVSKRLTFVAHKLSNIEGGNLVYANGAAEAEKIAALLYDLEPDVEKDEDIEELIKLIKKTVHPMYSLCKVLGHKIAFHYGNMPLIIRQEIEELFKAGKIKFLVCTSTLMEGVNMPAKTIFLRGPQRGRNKPLTEVDFWNLAGRAGRQGKEFQGNIVCIDTKDEKVWKNGIYSRKVKYPIKSTINDIFSKEIDNVIEYFREDQEGRNKKRVIQYDQAITYFLSIEHSFGTEKVKQKIGEGNYSKLQFIKEDIDNDIIPMEIIVRHHGISPYSQRRLLEYFIKNKKTEDELVDLIPTLPEDENASQCYVKIINRVTKYLEEDKFALKLSMYRAILVTNWMRGYQLSRIIEGNIKYHQNKEDSKNLPSIIRDTMRDIEEYARFKFVKYSSCYVDVLKLFFRSINREDLCERITDLNLWLEFGVSQTTQISLMSMGFSRTSAIALSEYISSDALTVQECREWITKLEIETLDVSGIIQEEIRRIQVTLK